MPLRPALPILIVACLSGTIATADAAQHARRGAPVIVPTTRAPIVSNAPTGSGLNTSGRNQPGVPNTATPGTIGTGASPSGLPGDNPSAPGFPGHVGK